MGVSLDKAVEPEGGHLGVALVGGVDAVLDVVESQAVVALEVDEDDGTALALLVGDELLDLLVDLGGAVVGIAVAVDEQGGQEDGSLGGGIVEDLQQLLHTAAEAGDVDVAHAVVGAGIDKVDVGAPLGRGLLSLLAHLVDDEARPALVLVVLHLALGVVADHIYVVAVLYDGVAQVFPVAVAVAGQEPVRDGCTQGHDAQLNAVRECARLVLRRLGNRVTYIHVSGAGLRRRIEDIGEARNHIPITADTPARAESTELLVKYIVAGRVSRCVTLLQSKGLTSGMNAAQVRSS